MGQFSGDYVSVCVKSYVYIELSIITSIPSPFMAVLRVLASVSALKEGYGFTVPSVGGFLTYTQIVDCHSYKDN